MKEWPADNKPADFEDLVKPFKTSFRFAYKMNRQNQDKDIPYDGFEHNSLHICFPMKEKFNVQNMQYDNEEQGRDALEVLIGAVLQVGIEQGRRIALDSPEFRSLKILADFAEESLNEANNRKFL